MKRLSIFILSVLVLSQSLPVAQAAWDSIKQKGNIKKGNMPVWDKNGVIEDSGISAASMTNAAAIAEVLSTNQASTIEFTTKKNQANGYAGLDENGHISYEALDYIVVVFAGAQAVDI